MPLPVPSPNCRVVCRAFLPVDPIILLHHPRNGGLLHIIAKCAKRLVGDQIQVRTFLEEVSQLCPRVREKPGVGDPCDLIPGFRAIRIL